MPSHMTGIDCSNRKKSNETRQDLITFHNQIIDATQTRFLVINKFKKNGLSYPQCKMKYDLRELDANTHFFPLAAQQQRAQAGPAIDESPCRNNNNS